MTVVINFVQCKYHKNGFIFSLQMFYTFFFVVIVHNKQFLNFSWYNSLDLTIVFAHFVLSNNSGVYNDIICDLARLSL